VYLMIMYLQTLQQQMRDDWNAGANMLVVTIVSLNPTETYGHYISVLVLRKVKVLLLVSLFERSSNLYSIINSHIII
jgi:hypothetical protein